MSGQFLELWAERLTNNEVLLVRNEVAEMLPFGRDESFIKRIRGKLTPLTDYFGHTNFLLPNPIEEKEDNGDIDCFFYYKNEKDKEKNIEILHSHPQVLKLNKNDNIYSFLFDSLYIGKKVQVDLHFVTATPNNCNNYFTFLQIPYFFFCLGYLLKIFKEDLDLKINQKWVSVVLKHTSVLIEKNLNNFLIAFFQLDDLNSMTSYKAIGEFFSKFGFNQWHIINNKQNNKVRANLREKDKFSRIVSYLNGDVAKVSQFFTDFKASYPFINKKIKQTQKEQNRILKLKQQRVQELEFFLGASLKDYKNPKILGNLIALSKELKQLKEMRQQLGEPLYLVGGSVRDILLGKSVKDFDITSSTSSVKFQEKFGWSINDKYGTVFCQYKGLEIEYTPFRTESNFDGRDADVKQEGDILTDSARRDFTINALYLDLSNGDILDHQGGLKDIQNKILRAVGNPNERFKEDYLRILRALRLSVKTNTKIEENTFKAMVEDFHLLKNISNDRILDELLRGLSLQNPEYNKILARIFNDSGLSLEIPTIWKERKSLFEYIKTLIEIIKGKPMSLIDFKQAKSIANKGKELYSYQAIEKALLFEELGIDKENVQTKKDLFLFLTKHYHSHFSALSRSALKLFVKRFFDSRDTNRWFKDMTIHNISFNRKQQQKAIQLDLNAVPYEERTQAITEAYWKQIAKIALK